MLQGRRGLRSRIAFALVLAGIASFAACVAQAQSGFDAQIRGSVTDPSGGIIVGAKVSLTDVATGIATPTVTNEKGIYTLNGLRPGKYNLVVEQASFQTAETKDITLAVSQQAVINVALRLASVSSSVSVTEASTVLDTGGATLGTTISGNTTREIPLYGRSYFPLVFLAGGVTESPGSGPADSYPSGTNFVSNGQRNATAEIRLDGTPTTAPEQGEGGNTNVYYQPSVEVIQEFKVSNNSFSAEYGNNGGTVLNVLMKQGGNQFHGSGWWFGQRSGLDANDFFSNAAGLPRPDHKHDDYGFMVNGPIKKEKTFFLFDYERVKDSSPIQIATTVPTLAERQGDFSQTNTADANGNVVPNIIYDPTSGSPGSRTQFSSNGVANIIPASRLNPIGMKILALYPTPNLRAIRYSERTITARTFSVLRRVIN